MNFQWIRKFNTGGTVSESRLITTDLSGNIYVCIYTNKFGTGLDIITIKYNTNGDSLWTRRYNDTANLDNTPKAIAVDGLNNVIIAGNTATPSSGFDGLLLKYAPNGDLVWKITYNDSANFDDEFNALAVDNLNNIYVTGDTKESSFYGMQGLTIKYNAQGNKLWESKYGYVPYVNEYGQSICLDPVNQYCGVLIQSDGEGTAFSGLIIIKYGCAMGDSMWTLTQSAGYAFMNPKIGKIIMDNQGFIYAASSTGTPIQARDYLLMKIKPSGDTSWMRTYGEVAGQGDEIHDIKLDNAKNVYISGESNHGSNSNWATIKYDSAGNRKWVSIYNRSGYGDVPCGLFLDKAGNVLVGGYGSSSYYDYILNKYNSNTGALINSYIYTNNYHDLCYGIAKDTSDNVYLTGTFSTTNTIIDLATMKLSPTTGISEISTEIPSDLFLGQNYPNPFNPTTKIEFKVESSKFIKLTVYDISGKEVAVLVNGKMSPGTYEVTFDGSNLSSGVYFYKLNAEKFSDTKKLILLK